MSVTNSLINLYPEIAKEWHPSKNTKSVEQMIYSTTERVWWRCDKGPDHEWSTQLLMRTKYGQGCPFCSHTRVSVTNSLANLFPDLVKEWHPNLNGKLTPNEIMPGTRVPIWWKCDKGPDHEWKTDGAWGRANRKYGCPFCTLTPQSRQELTITFELLTIFNGN